MEIRRRARKQTEDSDEATQMQSPSHEQESREPKGYRTMRTTHIRLIHTFTTLLAPPP